MIATMYGSFDHGTCRDSRKRLGDDKVLSHGIRIINSPFTITHQGLKTCPALHIAFLAPRSSNVLHTLCMEVREGGGEVCISSRVEMAVACD